jgi:hypothetical protein
LRDTNVLTPGTDANFITFFGSNSNSSVGAIQGNGAGSVEYVGAGNDFAEYLPKQTAADLLSAGDIVGMHSGQLSRVTAGADEVLVISTAPIVVGNAPGTDGERDTMALAALVGQAQVHVLGAVTAGSFIIPSGNNDGLGLAIAPENLTAEQAAQIAGQALESAAGEGSHTVRIAVGLPRDGVWANLLSRQNAGLQARVDALEKRAGAPAPSFASLLPWLLLAGVLLFSLGLFVGRRRSA